MAKVTITILDNALDPRNTIITVSSEPHFKVRKGRTDEETFRNLGRDGTLAQSQAAYMLIDVMGVSALAQLIVAGGGSN